MFNIIFCFKTQKLSNYNWKLVADMSVCRVMAMIEGEGCNTFVFILMCVCVCVCVCVHHISYHHYP